MSHAGGHDHGRVVADLPLPARASSWRAMTKLAARSAVAAGAPPAGARRGAVRGALSRAPRWPALVAAAVDEHGPARVMIVATTEAAARAAGDRVATVDERRAARRRARSRPSGRVRPSTAARRRARRPRRRRAPSPWRSALAKAHDAVAAGIAVVVGSGRVDLALVADVLDRSAPGVVATSSYTGSHAWSAVLLARQRRIPTVYVQHGPLFHFNYGTNLLHDRYLVWGEQDRRGSGRPGGPGRVRRGHRLPDDRARRTEP